MDKTYRKERKGVTWVITPLLKIIIQKDGSERLHQMHVKEDDLKIVRWFPVPKYKEDNDLRTVEIESQ